MNHAVVLIGDNNEKLGKILGDHPNKDGKIIAKSGRYGPYVEYNKVRATLPKNINLTDITLEEAIELINKKQQKNNKKTAHKK